MKSNAPAFIARTAVWMSPSPVMTITGKRTPSVCSRVWSCSPSIPGIITPRSTHPPDSDGVAARKANGVSYGTVANPAARSSRSNERRTTASSSTIWMVRSIASCLSLGGKPREREAKGGIGFAPECAAARVDRRPPKPSTAHGRTAYNAKRTADPPVPRPHNRSTLMRYILA